MKSIRFVVRPRLHLGLISMHEGGIRKNGGVGFAIKDPCGILDVVKAPEFCFEDRRVSPLNSDETRQLSELVESVANRWSFDSRVHVTFSGDLKTHVGMGSGTAIRLGVLEGLFCVNEKRISARELVRQSKRGGTSGIGINTYFSGGLVLDLGVPNNDNTFVPSSTGTVLSVPLSLPTVTMPKWPLCLCVPRSIPTKSQQEEYDFFARATPIENIDTFAAAYHTTFGIYASVVENDYSSFCRSICALQETKWKVREWSEYGLSLRELEVRLYELGASAVGMSSLGPMLYCFGETGLLDRIVGAAAFLNCDVTMTFPNNVGREIILG